MINSNEIMMTNHIFIKRKMKRIFVLLFFNLNCLAANNITDNGEMKSCQNMITNNSREFLKLTYQDCLR